MSNAWAFRLSIRGILIVTCGYVASVAVLCCVNFPLVAWYLRKWPQSEDEPQVVVGISPAMLLMLAFIQPFDNVTFFVATGILVSFAHFPGPLLWNLTFAPGVLLLPL